MALDRFISSAVILLIAATAMVVLFKRLGLGAIAGLLAAGVIVGPHTPGPSITTDVEGLRSFAELGVILLLFVIGLEIRPSRLWAMRRDVFGLGSLQIVVTTLVIAGYALLQHWSWKASLVVGMTMAASSTALVMQMLQERGEIASPHGRTAFGVLLMQDLAVVPMLAMLPALAGSGAMALNLPGWKQFGVIVSLFLLVWCFGKYIVPYALDKLAQQKNREGFLLVAMLSVFIAAWAMHQAGLSLALGAFIMGMLLSNSRYNVQIEAYLEPYKGLLISVFFVAVGMSIDLNVLAAHPFDFLQYALVVILLKFMVLFLLCRLYGKKHSLAARVSFLLAQGGEFGFVLLSSAQVLSAIDSYTYVTAIGVISVSMLFTPLLSKWGYQLAERLERNSNEQQDLNLTDKSPEIKKRVLIGGYGRVGHVVATLLQHSGIPIIVFDIDPLKVAQGKQDGFPVYYGDIANPELLVKARVEQAALVVLTVDQQQTALQAVSHVCHYYPNVPVIARARDLDTSGKLLQAGARLAPPEAIESSLRLAAEALNLIGVDTDNVDHLLSDVRKKDYELVQPPE